MAQFDVYKNTNRATKSLYPYLVDIQSDFLSDLKTTVVIPLASEKDYIGKPLSNLHPSLNIAGKKHIAMTSLIAGIERNILGEKITSLSRCREQMLAALDFMITGV